MADRKDQIVKVAMVCPGEADKTKVVLWIGAGAGADLLLRIQELGREVNNLKEKLNEKQKS